MENKNQQVIKQGRQEWFEPRRQLAARLRHSRENNERFRAEIRLIIDDLQSEGHSLDTPLGRSLFTKIIQSRMPKDEEDDCSLEKGFPSGY